MKISTFVISLILVGIIVGTLSFFYAGLADNYSVTYDNTSFDTYNQLENLQANAEEINDTITEFNPSNPVDIIGGFLSGGFQVLKVTWNSFTTFTTIGEESADKIGDAVGGGGFGLIKNGLFLIAFIIFIFLIVSVFVGKDI